MIFPPLAPLQPVIEFRNVSLGFGEAPVDNLPRTRIMVLESGKLAFTGSLAEFQACELPSVKRLLTLDLA